MKNKIKQFFILSLTLFIFVISIFPTYAARDTSYHDDWPGAAKTAYNMAKEIYEPYSEDLTDYLYFNNDANVTAPITNSNIETAQKRLWESITAVYNVLKPVGYMFCVLYFLIDMIDRTTKEQMNPEHFLRQFIKLLVAIMLIDYGLTFFESFMSLSNAFLDSIKNANVGQSYSGPSTDALSKFAGDINDEGTSIGKSFLALQFMAINVIPWLGTKVAQIIIMIICWSRLIELGARMCFAPIGMADVFTNGFNGSGFRYMKKIFAVALQGVFIFVILKMIGGMLSGVNLSSSAFVGVTQIVIMFTEIGLIKRAQSLANDLLGV